MSLPPTAGPVLDALVDLGGEAGAGELAAAAKVPARSVTRALVALREAGLVEGAPGGKGRVRLTASGRAQHVSADPVSAGAVVDDALALWADLGLWAHRAFLELVCSAVAARAALAAVRPEGHLGFMAVGDSGTGKSALAAMIRQVFGLDRARHVLDLPSQTTGAVLGRREPAPGGGQRWVPSPVAALPFVLFDEFDKADEPVRRAVLPYFQGDVEVQAEGEVQRLLPTPMLAANVPVRGERLGHLRGEYRRRSVVLDTGYAADRGGAIERALTGYYASPRAHLVLADLTAPPAVLDDDAREVLSQVDEVLTAAGRQERSPLRVLEAAALGRAALAGDTSAQGQVYAALSVVLAYVVVTEQVPGQVQEGWSVDLAGMQAHLEGHGDVDQLEQVLAASRAARARAQHRVAQVRVARHVEDLELVQARHTLAEQLGLAREAITRRVPDADRPTAAGLRAALKAQRQAVLDCRDRARLEDLRAVADPPLQQAWALRQRIDHDAAQQRVDVEQAAAAARQDRDIARRHVQAVGAQQRDAQRAAREQGKAQLAHVREQIRQLEQWWKRRTTPAGEQPWLVLKQAGLLRYDPPPPRERGGGFLSRMASAVTAPTGGLWVATGDPRQVFPGTSTSCPELARWDEATRAVLRPFLTEAHAREDRLVAAGAGRARSGRPALHRPQVPAALPAGRR